MHLVWKPGEFRYRKALNAYINFIRVASIAYYGARNTYQIIIHLPGAEKCVRTFHSAADAQPVAQDIIDNWFKKVTA